MHKEINHSGYLEKYAKNRIFDPRDAEIMNMRCSPEELKCKLDTVRVQESVARALKNESIENPVENLQVLSPYLLLKLLQVLAASLPAINGG